MNHEPLQAEEKLENWYRVDVILFKPRRTDLDEESWPDAEPSYPVNVISVTEPRPFKLSQLEQLDEIPELKKPEDQVPILGSDEFLFESQSQSDRNQRVIEAITGVSEEPPEEAEIESATDPAIEAEAEPEITGNPVPQALPEADPFSPGTLAFSRTDDESSLHNILRSLNRSSRFDVLGHYSWLQPIDNEPTPVMMQTGQRYDDRYEIEGTLSFTRSRYLHVQTDLWYTHFEPRGGSANPFLTGIDSSLNDEMLEAYADLVDVERQRGQYFPARTHQMVQSRRMRSNELHYLDHPLFGVIVRINRFEVQRHPEVEG
ncbi:MAG: hypothetical protein HOC70_07460 [Gammaproteobacteria bacterium]|jgi:hypothetical protein|nr:hypothetical protein [Gammaproteobacteria bacterium]MBT4493066.1 hypothetical protein [Gammaproteobacteria bacterium]MBT7369274.1 hypothetical protein [Gammaproteobacteria bacterium]